MILYLFSGISGLISFLKLCLFDCSARLDAARSSGWWREWVSFFSLSPRACGLCLQDASANLLSPSSPAIPLCACWAAVVRGVCSRPAVSVPFSVAFISDLTNIKAWSSMCDCRFARFASAEMWRQFKDSSSSNNCSFEKVQLHVSLSKAALPGWGEN